MKKRLIIVCNSSTKEYGDFLMSLISKDESDKNPADRIVGENVDVFLWNIKQYKSAMHTLNHENYILFLGESDEATSQGKCIDWSLDKYGLRYGWLGKRAVLYVENRPLHEQEYKDFVDYANESQDITKIEKIEREQILNDYWMDIDMLIKAPRARCESRPNARIINQQYRCLVALFYMNGLKEYLR